MERIKGWLKFAGKSEQKVAAVFGVSPERCAEAVAYLRKELPDVPVWLFATCEPLAATKAECERVAVAEDSMELLVTAEKELWPRRVALALTTWTGEHGRWPVKLAPFFVPMFHVLLMNDARGFFAPSPGAIRAHCLRRAREAVQWVWNRVRDWSRGTLLLVLGWVAQGYSPLSRWFFWKRQGSEPLALPSVAASGSGVVCFRYGNRQWDRRKLNELIESAQAPYLLLQDGPGEDALEDALPLFGRARTFAVARQADYRAWSPMLFARAPFRQLQPGTASQTHAPTARTILFDREKLRLLGGIPETIVPGTALFIIFAKAAAAGWRSYTAGGTRKLEEAVDWPYEEAEFVTRLFADPKLRQLGPREPDLARGNISTAIGAPQLPPRGSGCRPRVLVVSPYLPYPLSHGGAVRIWNLCRALAGRVDFILAAFREKGDTVHFDKLHEVFREVYALDIDEKASPDETLPKQVRGHVSRSMRALIAELCREKQIDLMQVEFTHMAGFRDAAPEVPAILVEHDITFTLYRQFAERDKTEAARAEYERWLAFESRWYRSYEAVWTMSEDDREQALAQGSRPERTDIVANGVDIERFVPAGEPAEFPELFYVGSFRHLPNILGFEKLLYEVMPRVWKRYPEARLRVVAGPDHKRYWREFQKRAYPDSFDPRVIVHGFVEDLRPLYATAAIVLVPLLVSAGTNIKVMEAMACRKAVVSTPIGCAGLGLRDGEDAVIRAESPEFAEAVCELLGNAALREAIATEARRTVEQRFSWGAIAEAAYESYLKTAGVPAR